jgi:hypothetical protein
MLKSNNLSDLVDKNAARQNLNVYSKTNIDDKIKNTNNEIAKTNRNLSNKVDKVD